MAGSKWRISDELWEKMVPLITEHKTNHPLSTHRKRVDSHAAMNAILYRLPVERLNAIGICPSSAARNGAMQGSSSASGRDKKQAQPEQRLRSRRVETYLQSRRYEPHIQSRKEEL